MTLSCARVTERNIGIDKLVFEKREPVEERTQVLKSQIYLSTAMMTKIRGLDASPSSSLVLGFTKTELLQT